MKTIDNCTECKTKIKEGFICCPICGKSVAEMEKEEEIETSQMEEDRNDYPDGFNPELYDM